MSNTESYEGWTNRETWAVALHINNDQGWQESVHEALRGAMTDDADGFWNNVPTNRMADYRAGEIIRENVEETLDLLLESVHQGDREQDVYSSIRDDIGSLWRVDWTELGAAFLSDLDES